MFFETRIAQMNQRWREATRRFRREEDGALIIFSLYAVAVMIMIGGIAVDVIITEEKRTRLQYTIDGAVLAAADLEQGLDAAVIMEGHFKAAGFESVRVNYTKNDVVQPALGPDDAEVIVSLNTKQGLNFRNVRASANVAVDTLFMHWLGIGYLTAPATGAAEERITDIEISLVLDVSGSMGDPSQSGNSKMYELKKAAREFIDEVVVNEPGAIGLTSLSIVPYYQTVHAGADLLDQLNADGGVKMLTQETNPPGLSQVNTEHDLATCIDFKDSDFLTTAIQAKTATSAGTPLARKPHYAPSDNNFSRPDDWDRECEEGYRTEILLHQTDPQVLKTHLNGMIARGNTAIDVGMKWGVAALDPAFEPAITALSKTPALPSAVAGRPADYWDPITSTDPQDETLKVIVLMTDGRNTSQRSLPEPDQYPYIDFTNDKTDVWEFSDAEWAVRFDTYDSDIGRKLRWYDRYLVKIPENDEDYRWFRPGSPWTNNDDRWYHEDAGSGVVMKQLDWITLLDRFSLYDAAHFFWDDALTNNGNWRSGDSPYEWMLWDHDSGGSGAQITSVNSTRADTRLSNICEEARKKHVVIYAIGFEAESDGEKAMKDCATSDGYYFDVNGEEIGTAFQAIANQINQLRLTQ